jgi:hypothetical protein
VPGTIMFVAVHESDFGTKRTAAYRRRGRRYRDGLLIVRFRGEADMHRGVASTASVVNDPKRTLRRLTFRNAARPLRAAPHMSAFGTKRRSIARRATDGALHAIEQ